MIDCDKKKLIDLAEQVWDVAGTLPTSAYPVVYELKALSHKIAQLVSKLPVDVRRTR